MSTSCRTDELRLLDERELEVEMTLPGAIRDRQGNVLIPAGQTLTEAQLISLRERGPVSLFAGPDWKAPVVEEKKEAAEEKGESDDEQIVNDLDSDSPPDPAELIAALQLRRDGKRSKRIRREPRHPAKLTLTVTISEQSEEGCRERTLEVRTADLSARGFAFLHKHYVHPGTAVRTCIESLPAKPQLMGVVRNCTHLRGDQHRVGVEFTKVIRESDRRLPPEFEGE